MAKVYCSASCTGQKYTCIILWSSITAVAVILMCITLAVRFSGSRNVLTFSSTVGHTRLINYPSNLCSGGTMTVSPLGLDGATMYLLDEKPPLSAWNILYLVGSFQIDAGHLEDYHFYDYDTSVLIFISWQFHLHPGSIITTTSCVVPDDISSGANFAVVQGSKNYHRWVYNPSTYSSYSISLSQCGSGESEQYTYSITNEGYYYVVFSITTGTPLIRLAMTINRTEYSAAGGGPSCTLNNGDLSCSAQPSSSSRYALFQTSPPSQFNITAVDYLTLQWTCDSQDSSYALIYFVPLFTLVLSFCGCFGIYWLYNQHNQVKHWHKGQDHPHISTNDEPVLSEEPPPPYNILT